MMKILFRILLPVFLFSASMQLMGQTNGDATSKLRQHIEYLASDELAGRKAGSPGDSMAAVYIRDQFAKAGLTLGANNGFQYFSLVSDIKAGPDNRFQAGDETFTADVDFNPFSFSTSDSRKGEVVFAGFGISGNSGELNWDDFKGLDVKDKWVIALRGDPEPENQASAFIPIATDRAKALAMKDRGAAGLLLVSPSSIEKKDQPVEITFDKSVSDAGLPVISITRSLAAKLLQLPVTAIDSIEKVMINDSKSIVYKPGVQITASTDVIREKVISRNVIGSVEGADPLLKNEYIVIGAHYDHLGMGGFGSGSRVPEEHAVHGGADDNASGVASIIQLAEWYGKAENRPSRSLMFISFGGEEMGLLGSRYFVSHPTVELSSIKAMINLDMVGRLKTDSPNLTLSGTGTFSQCDDMLDQLSVNLPFDIKRSPDGYGPSDHAAFYGEGIPVLFVTTGAHDDYHTPRDKANLINYEGQVAVTEFVQKITDYVSDMKPAPEFKEAGSRQQAARYGRNLKVTLGIMPDVSGGETSGGMKVEGVRKDGPAAAAGMEKGDIIIAINGLPVGNIYDYMGRLGKLKPGDRASIEILRQGVKEVLIVQL